jgi:hypothetical protein
VDGLVWTHVFFELIISCNKSRSSAVQTLDLGLKSVIDDLHLRLVENPARPERAARGSAWHIHADVGKLNRRILASFPEDTVKFFPTQPSTEKSAP